MSGEDGNIPTDNQHRRRKRKSGLISRFKKFGSQGKLGRGYEINADTYNYFLKIFEHCNKNQFENDEERDILVNNAFKQTENEEVHLSSNQFTSRVLETLINLTRNDEVLIRFTSTLTPSLRTLCVDPYASHVLEKLFEVISEKWFENETLIEWFRSTCKFVMNNYEDFVFDNYANHVMRKACQCLSRTIHIFSSKVEQFNAATSRLQLPLVIEPIAIPDSPKSLRKAFKKNLKILKEFAEAFINWPQFNDLFQNEVTSGLVRTLVVILFASNEPSLMDKCLQKIVLVIGENDVIGHTCNVHTLEACISVSISDPDLFLTIFEKYFKGRLLSLINEDRGGHYIIERLFQGVPNRETFDIMFEELETHFSEIYNLKYHSVFTSIATACQRLKSKQNNFMVKLSELFEEERSARKETFVDIILRFGKTFQPKHDGSISFMTELQGCLVLQQMLNFHKPHKITRNFVEMDGLKLSKLGQDPKGSHVIDSFFKSETVGEKAKESILTKLKEHLLTMASTKFGARVLQNLFSFVNLKQKEMVASVLAPREAQLNANTFGKFVSASYQLSIFKQKPKEWAMAIREDLGNKEVKRKKTLDRFAQDLGLDILPIPSKKIKKEPNF